MNNDVEPCTIGLNREQFYAKCSRLFENSYFWAKTTIEGLPGCEVWQHSIAAAEVIERLMKVRPDYRRLLPDGITTLVAVHDVGKISPGFQTKCPMWNGPDCMTNTDMLRTWCEFYEKNHTRSTYDILFRYYKEHISKKCGRCWAECAGAHHGAPASIQSGATLPETWRQYCETLIELLIEWYGPLPVEKPNDSIRRVATGAIIVSDWIASHEDFFSPERIICDYNQKAKEAIRRIGWQGIEKLVGNLSWTSLFPHCLSPRPLQQYMWNLPAKQGVYVVEDAMGGGKTEAALALAYHLLDEKVAHGIYFALPTQTTSNRIYYRLRRFIEACGFEVNEASIQLSHGASWLLQDSIYTKDAVIHLKRRGDGSSEMRRWFSSSKRTLLVPFGVGTVDQALMGVVAVKHRDVRAFALAGKVVILDEVHSYDFYTGSLIAVLVRQLCETGSTVIILSATLTQARIRELLDLQGNVALSNEYPLVTSYINGCIQQRAFLPSEKKTITLDVVGKSAAAVAELAYERARKGQCVLWIRNTVKDAQEAFRMLKNEAYEDGPEIALLHARFPYWRRDELEQRWIDCLGASGHLRPCGCVLVATQVVEQSVDIDADYLITDFAPTDMLLQRAGRLWRHVRPNRPCEEAEMMVVVPEGVPNSVETDDVQGFLGAFGTTAKVYAPYVLWRTWKVWQYLPRLVLPDDIRRLIESTYGEVGGFQSCIADKTYKEMKTKYESLQALVNMNQSYTAGVATDSDGVFTRYGGIESLQVLLLKQRPVPRGDGSYEYLPLHGAPVTVCPQRWSYETAKSIYENSVRIPAWLLNDFVPDPNLEQFGFNPIYPFFVLENAELMYYSGEQSRLAWNDQMGVYELPT